MTKPNAALRLLVTMQWLGTAAAGAAVCATLLLATAATMLVSATATSGAQQLVELGELEELASAGDKHAQLDLGSRYTHGQGVRQDDNEAVWWYKLAADQGLAEAQSQLGWCYEHGRGVLQNYTAAATWYRQGADQGLAAAQARLGNLYRLGRGVLLDDGQGARWLRLAARQGHGWGQLVLGELYRARGDTVRAHMWLNIASANGRDEAAEKRDQVGARMDRTELGRAMQRARTCMASEYEECQEPGERR